MPKKLLCLFPYSADTNQKFLYLVGLKDGAVKIGCTCDLRSRIKTHRQAMGENFAWVHGFMQPKSGWLEWRLKNEFSRIGQRVRRTEVFHGIDKVTAIATCRQAIHANIDQEIAHAEHQRKQERWELFLTDARRRFAQEVPADEAENDWVYLADEEVA